MNRLRLVLSSLRHHRRTNIGVVLGIAVAAAVLVGALVVGDSVRATLRLQALQRIGHADLVLTTIDRFFTASLAETLGDGGGGADEVAAAAPLLRLGGVASLPDASARAGDVQVLGVDERFFSLALDARGLAPPEPDDVHLNERLARQLGVRAGDRIVVRVARPSAMPRDLVMAQTDEVALALRLQVDAIVPDDAYGRFGLAASQVPPMNAFVALPWLQEQLDLDGRVNLVLLAGGDAGRANRAVEMGWMLDDAGLAVDRLAEGDPTVELTSRRIFIDEPVVEAAAAGEPPTLGLLTYFVNELRRGERFTPYSMVTAVGPLDPAGLGWSIDPGWSDVVPADLGDDEIVINDWLANDLDAKPGDEIELRYFVPGPDRRLVEQTSVFRVRQVVPMTGPADDPTLMPAFPGLADAEHCRDWEPGIPVDLERVRDEDEAYWDEHRGTPKAFVSLAAGQHVWSNRFGTLTAIRAAAGEDLGESVRERLDPASLGLFVQDLRGPALAAGTSATDFGGLFLGLSIFLIAAALLLTALLFVFGVEQRAAEIGTLLAVGFRSRDVRNLLLAEGVVLAVIGTVVGAAAGLAYTRLVLWGLGTVWRDAVGQTTLRLDASPATVAIGIVAAIAAAVVSMWLAMRRQVRRPAVELISGGSVVSPEAGMAPSSSWRVSAFVAVIALLLSIGIVASVGTDRGQAAAGAFFGAGALLLVAGLAASRAILTRLGPGVDRRALTVAILGLRNSIRRRGRSLATVALLACGTFLVVAVGANRLDPLANPDERASGTGGFELFAETTIGVVHDLDDAEGREAFGLDDEDLRGVSVVPMRVREGDDASCLNLSRVQKPRLVAVRPETLASLGAFRFARVLEGSGVDADAGSAWRLLEATGPSEDGRRVVPAIGDQASVTWVMHKSLGDRLEYVDERGRPFDVRIVATLANSLLQGSLVIDDAWFTELYPSESGARMFLIDTPPEAASEVSGVLTSALRDVGFEATPTVDRLAEFSSVQNTYLAIFQVLGGLGLLLGSVGLGLVVARNVLERRGEMALLRAVGFRVRSVRWMVFSEHGLLLALGLTAGTLAALVAVLPAIASPGADVPYATTTLLLVTLVASGVIWVWLATVLVVRGRLLDALRNE